MDSCKHCHHLQPRHRHDLFLLVVITLYLSRTCCSSELPTAFTPVNWSLVSPDAIAAVEASRQAPLGCTCLQRPSGGGACVMFECPCACDLTAGACDPFCCCDPECTAEHVAATQAQALCLTSEPVVPTIEYCATDLSWAALAKGVDPLVADSVLCVSADNSEVAGEFISAAREEAMTVANAFQRNPKRASFQSVMKSAIEEDMSSGDSTAAASSAYLPGDTIRVLARSIQDITEAPILLGRIALPGASVCSQRNPVRFGFDWPTTRCMQHVADLDRMCSTPGSPLDAGVLAANVWIARNPGVAITDGLSSPNDLIAVEVTLQVVDLTTGSATTLKAPYPSYYPSPQILRNETVVSCHGALLGVAYAVFHNSEGQIERVEALVSIGEVTTAAANATSGDSTVSASENESTPMTMTHAILSLPQTFSVAFVSTATLDRSIESGNLQTLARSGNPGYVVHLPVRVGVLETSRDAALVDTAVISEMTSGLTLPGLGACAVDIIGVAPTVTQPATTDPLTVLFGEDLRISCTLTLTAAAFQSFCERESALVPALMVNATHVAAFGNADPLVASEWLELEYEPPASSSTSFSDATATASMPGSLQLTCSKLVTSLHYEFLVAAVGPTTNLQQKIIAARASHGQETWTFWSHGDSDSSRSKTETYVLTTTVSFVSVAALAREQWIPPTPPLWFSIPSDVFYPFKLGNAAERCHLTTIPTVLMVLPWLIILALLIETS